MKEEFEKRLKMLKRRFCFEYGGLLIRPAESFEELEIEGHTLHHCVSTYAEKHFKGQTTIFFIRRKDEPSSPYYTLEYHDGRVIQCRTVYNGAQTDEVKAFIAEWEKYILNTQINKIKEIA